MRRMISLLFLSILSLALFLGATAGPATAASSSPVLTKAEIKQAEQWLKDLGYWTGPVDGVWDAASRHALIAFQKVERARATGRLTRAEHNALSVAAPHKPKELSGDMHVEVDIARQVLFLVDAEGKVGNILPISSGSGKRFKEAGYPEAMAITPCARLEVYQKVSGWRKSPLGEMYNPLYVVGGIAIHGSADVPAHPASHGCIRVPLYASPILAKMIPVGTPVLIYGCQEDRKDKPEIAAVP
ncbi:MAG TPA: L,D-transpeptidase family protein [Thermoanaerobaculia bacterium]|nr:L,D-transpeptidase family protein [Thermoanaerobaculia bacterium]